MLVLITSGEGIPHFLAPGQPSGDDTGVYVAGSGMYREANIISLHQAGVSWVSRVPETILLAQARVPQRSCSRKRDRNDLARASESPATTRAVAVYARRNGILVESVP